MGWMWWSGPRVTVAVTAEAGRRHPFLEQHPMRQRRQHAVRGEFILRNVQRGGEAARVADWDDKVWISFAPSSAIVLAE